MNTQLKDSSERYLSKVRGTVDRYKPLIEERVNLDLKEIEVRDSKYLISDLRKNSDWCKDVGFTISKIFWPILELMRMNLEKNSGMSMQYNFSNIYVFNKFQTDLEIETTVIHELTHHLWTRLGGVNHGGSKKRNLFLTINEGYAVYGERVWFSDFIQNRSETSNPSILMPHYEKGFKAIERIVRDHEKGSLLHIPRNWEQCEKYI